MLIEHCSLHFSGDWFGDLGRGSMLIEHCSLHFFWRLVWGLGEGFNAY